MKKLLAVLLMMAMLGMCAPSFGYFLVYKCIISGIGIDDTGGMGSVKFKAYLVLDIDDSVVSKIHIDNSSFLLYDRIPGPKFFTVLVDGDDYDIFLELSPTSASADVVALSIEDLTGFGFANVVGKLKAVDVGLVGKKYVATSIKGHSLVGSANPQAGFGNFLMTDVIGSSSITGTLSKTMSKEANKSAAVVTATDVTDVIADNLIAKGFEEF